MSWWVDVGVRAPDCPAGCSLRVSPKYHQELHQGTSCQTSQVTYPDSGHAGQHPSRDLYEFSALLPRFHARDISVCSCVFLALLPTSALRNKNSTSPTPLSSIQAKTIDVPTLMAWKNRVFSKIQTNPKIQTYPVCVLKSRLLWFLHWVLLQGDVSGHLEGGGARYPPLQLPQRQLCSPLACPLFVGIPLHPKGSTTRESGRSAAQERLRQAWVKCLLYHLQPCDLEEVSSPLQTCFLNRVTVLAIPTPHRRVARNK